MSVHEQLIEKSFLSGYRTDVVIKGTPDPLPVVFTLSYASHYYRHTPPAGLKFPDDSEHFQPNYVDFLYFSFTIAVAAQTADVVITRRPMRRLVLLQSVLSFTFNAAILALAINIAAGLLPAVR